MILPMSFGFKSFIFVPLAPAAYGLIFLLLISLKLASFLLEVGLIWYPFASF